MKLIRLKYHLSLLKDKIIWPLRLKTMVKIFWHELWVRKDEFHSSLDMLHPYEMLSLTKKQRDEYLLTLVQRRNIAHEREIKDE